MSLLRWLSSGNGGHTDAVGTWLSLGEWQLDALECESAVEGFIMLPCTEQEAAEVQKCISF